MVYGFINFLFPFLSHISFIFLLQQLSIHRLHLHSPILFLFPSSLLIYSFPIREYEPPPISSLPSLIYFTGFFFPLLFSLPSLFYLRVAYWRGSLGCGSLFYLEPSIRCSLFSESPIHYSISEGFIDSPFL